MICVELKKPNGKGTPDELEIRLDSAGLEFLLAQLQLLRNGKTEHVHLMSESWGGGELSDAPPNDEYIAMQHVKILFRGG